MKKFNIFSSLSNYSLLSPYYTLSYLWLLDWKVLHYHISIWSLLPQNTRKDKHSAGFKHGKYGKSSWISLSPVVHSRELFPWKGTVYRPQKLESGEFWLFQRLIVQNECSSLLERRERELFAFYKKKKDTLADLSILTLWDSAETFREFCFLFGVLGKTGWERNQQ